jgi:hypothetical protein
MAMVRRSHGKPAADEVARYLPANYKVTGEDAGAVVIEGTDDHGWTLDDYVIPRLASGLIHAEELPRPLHKIHDEIVYGGWPEPYFGARPYIHALRYLGTMDDKYYEDTADEIVQRFLTNARTWRGPVAKRIKAELRGMLAGHRKAVRR